MPNLETVCTMFPGTQTKLAMLTAEHWEMVYMHPLTELYLQEAGKLFDFNRAASYDEITITPWYMELQTDLVMALERQFLQYVNDVLPKELFAINLVHIPSEQVS